MNKNDLKKILKSHLKWLTGKNGRQADLSGADLRGVNLSGANLDRTQLNKNVKPITSMIIRFNQY